MNTYLTMAITGLGITATGIYLFKRTMGVAGEQSPAQDDIVDSNGTRRLHLSKASKLWTDKQIPLEKVSILWVEPPKEKTSLPRPSFINQEIGTFWDEIAAPRYTVSPSAIEVVAAILAILDKMGECPSVVRNPKQSSEPGNAYSENEFKMLSRIPLWQHSLSVARNMAMRVGRDILVPESLIVSLAHDLGKIPAYHDRGYVTGNHSRISTSILLGIKGFDRLTNGEELVAVVKEHHYLKPSGRMSQLLKECDQITRNKEFADLMNSAVAAEQREEVVTRVSVTATAPTEELPQPEQDPDTLTDMPNEGRENRQGTQPERIDVSWLDQEAFLAVVKNWINKTHEGRWGVVSMPDGTVYANDTTIWNLLKKAAPDSVKPELATATADPATKRSILYSVVWSLSEGKNAVAAELLKPEHYMVPVVMTNGTGKTATSMLIPFRAEAFGALPSDLEKLKQPKLQSMVKTIKPLRIGDET